MAILPKGADWLTYKGKYKHPHADAVQHKTRRAIKSGRLIKPSACSKCGRTDKPIQAHHTDCSKPLEVVWLCVPCHQKIPKRPKGYRWSEIDLDIWRNERARRQARV